MSDRIYWNEGFRFKEQFEEAMLSLEYDDSQMEEVRIPHTVKETPLHYFSEEIYQMVSCYRRSFVPSEEWKGKRITLTFEGAAHRAEVYLNGRLKGVHACGYTAFSVDLTEDLLYGKENILAVKLDSRESLNIPPFGHVVDYMTFGGIYRDVYITVADKYSFSDIFVRASLPEEFVFEEGQMNRTNAELKVKTTVRIPKQAEKESQELSVRFYLEDFKQDDAADGEMNQEIAGFLGEIQLTEHETETQFSVADILPWDVTDPNLYTLHARLLHKGTVTDERTVRFGFRKAEFKKDGFYLNGRKFKICGLNRHQSYPYAGYAMPESMQKLDADILKNELHVNAVRTSHYPQSHYFVDRCDELGLLVFMEFPGWQHIGNGEWKEQACTNLEEMILQYRNHSSIIIWGVRINESADDDEFYEKTNRIAHALDDSRPTGGVRASKKSHLLEDVYTYNDFVHDGRLPGCEPKKNVTSDLEKPYLITEYNGHMFPTKNYDCEEHRMEHAIRHANVLNAVAGEADICGSFGWCMFDYNTHKDFGSGDRICYHGVMDMFRNPKMAAYIYACQNEEEPVLAISSSMDIGEHPACNRGDTWIFTNADSVRMYKNDIFIREYKSSDSPYKNLKHGPILIDDFIGEELHKNENFSAKQADAIKNALNMAATRGLGNLPLTVKLSAVKLMLFYHMKLEDAVELYNRYIGDWGGTVTAYRFEAIKDGKTVKTIHKKPMERLQLMVCADHTELTEKHTYDVAAVRIGITDEYDNILPYYGEPVILELNGAAELIGPDVISVSGGMTGTYVRTKGEKGTAELTVRTGSLVETVKFTVR